MHFDGIIIRDITLDDLADLANVYALSYIKTKANKCEFEYDYTIDSLHHIAMGLWIKEFKDTQNNSNTQFLKGAYNKSALTGFIHYGSKISLQKKNRGESHVHGLYVHPDGWAEGIVSALFNTAKDDLAAKGYQKMSLLTDSDMIFMRDFYKNKGRAEGRQYYSAAHASRFIEYNFDLGN
ncbi:MAG: GNAT family N-acetyltransferase [Micavibrio sp.]|nr:GNAT family N-acetyltransferase [Micavibrio sp.]